jgi:hypothetical protein
MDPVVTDPVALVDQLNVETLRGRLAELGAQEHALRVLLRAAPARERGRRAHGDVDLYQRPGSPRRAEG